MRLALALIFALMFSASSPATAADLDDCIKKSGQEAIRACSDIIERGEKESVQDRARAFYDRGIEYMSQRAWDKAISDFSEAIKLNPNETNTLYSRGLTYDNKGDREKAIADYTEVIRIDPKYVNAFGARGLAYEAKGDLRRASDDFRAAIALRADDKVGTDGLQRVGKRLAEVQNAIPYNFVQIGWEAFGVRRVLGSDRHRTGHLLMDPRPAELLGHLSAAPANLI